MPIVFSTHQIQLLENLLKEIPEDLFANQEDVVFKSTIGQHTRHIIDFYQAFFMSYSHDTPLCYDHRRKVKALETNLDLCIKTLGEIRDKLPKIVEEKQILVMSIVEGKHYQANSSTSRELLFLKDHTTHHIAVIRLMLAQFNTPHKLSNSLGLAHSTTKQ